MKRSHLPRVLLPLLALPFLTGFTDLQYAVRVAGLEARIVERLGDQQFHIVVEPPFVVIGDEPKTTVKRRATGTVRWASEKLSEAYFEKEPDRILEVWLFKDARSYQRNARRLFGELPSTPYGFYSASDNALVMNIATGGGTLVHEIVHPYIEANLPGCPSWLDEGLGSLYEQSSERRGRIVGQLNWRLPGLQTAIAAGELPTFRELISTTPHAFYREDPGTHYAQSRYLLYYLQEAGLLRGFYLRYRKQRAIDPTGYRSLRQVLGRRESEMAAFQQEWAEWVMRLRYPASS